MPLPRPLKILVILAAVSASALGCQAKIGDDCATGTDCSQTGGRVCDTSMPGGYCTIPNCEPDKCPEEAACVAFVLAPSTAEACLTIGEMRGVRSFCMRRCSSQDDCRGGYECLDLHEKDNAWGAQRVDQSSTDGRVCALRYGAIPAIEAEKDAAKKRTTDDRGAERESTSYCSANKRGNENDQYYSAGGAASWLNAASAGSAGWAGAAGSAGSGDGTAGATSASVASSGAAGVAGD